MTAIWRFLIFTFFVTVKCCRVKVRVEESVQEAFLTSQLVPDVVFEVPYELADVRYPSGVTVHLGNELTPTEVKDTPFVTWRSNCDGYYTLAMIDPDVPSRVAPNRAPLLHWLVVNIKGDNVSAGETLAEYIGAGPPKGTGLHRYALVVFRQHSRQTFDEQRVSNTSLANRNPFYITDFAKKHNLGNLVAGNFFEAQYDDYVPILLKAIGFT